MVRATRVPYLLDDKGRPSFDVKFYAVNKAGETGSAAMWSGAKYAVCRSGSKPMLMDCAYLYQRDLE
jgi:N4-(beta-N-acetylglucosaminyl)-L-asparaginase